MSTTSINVEKFYTDLGSILELKLIGGASGLKRLIREPTVNRPGLALAGFKRYFAPKRVQVIGNVETAYLRSLPAALTEERVHEFFAHRIPCAVFCRDLKPGRVFLSAAEKADVPLFITSLITMKFISRATFALENLFAPRTQMHGGMVDIGGVGVVIEGESGIGKSEAVVGLLERGHSLVADDVVCLWIQDGNELRGTAKELGRNLMEVRGIGLIDVAAMFGVSAIRHNKRVDVLVSLKRWEETQQVDRLGLDQAHVTILGQPVPHIVIPVRPGRDLSSLIEVAAYQTKLRLAGYHAAAEFSGRITRQMQPKI
ncbi:MAG TPA: HPr(Ser) kinase/phosphatase [Verrucomicrobiota bacterium]|nr:HPr(Ser) kinase/phosphatase [Verrucomicrobiales bacterium]HRI16573.1 HPr(Ser) kinase/phosphatase [Verrucomicrobiota bacterium]